MTTTLVISFWALAILVFYTYLGYGIVLRIMLYFKLFIFGKESDPVLPEDECQFPDITLMICAFNEEYIIREKMENIHQLKYPKSKLHIMWVTDGSNDHSNELLSTYPDVQLVYSPERKGKAAAMQHGLQENNSEFVVFTDANTMLNPDAIREIYKEFLRPNVSCVSGEKRVTARKEGQVAAEGEGLYWKYESKLKKWDSELYSAMGAAGELFAVRMAHYQPAPSNALLDDFMISMLILKQGHKIAYTPNAYAEEHGSVSMAEESKRKRRIAAGGLQSIWWLRSMMNPFKSPIVSFQFISHRVLRWSITPFALLALIPLNAALIFIDPAPIYLLSAFVQIMFYLMAAAGFALARRGKKHKLLYIPYYFLFMNFNVFEGIAYLRTHKSAGIWEKAQRE